MRVKIIEGSKTTTEWQDAMIEAVNSADFYDFALPLANRLEEHLDKVKIKNEQQEIFCQKYALCGNASRSAKDAGYAPSSAKVQGHKLLKKPRILERIEELSQEMTTSYDVVQELERQYAYA